MGGGAIFLKVSQAGKIRLPNTCALKKAKRQYPLSFQVGVHCDHNRRNKSGVAMVSWKLYYYLAFICSILTNPGPQLDNAPRSTAFELYKTSLISIWRCDFCAEVHILLLDSLIGIGQFSFAKVRSNAATLRLWCCSGLFMRLEEKWQWQMLEVHLVSE